MRHVLEVFFSEHCLGCPEARRAVREYAAGRSDVTVVERDIEIAAELELARERRLIATPAVVIDGDRVLYGVPRPSVLDEHLDRTGDTSVDWPT